MMKLTDAVNAVLETWSGSTEADLDSNPEYGRGQVELIVELYGRGYIDDDLNLFGDPDDRDYDNTKAALTEHIRQKVRLANETFKDVVARQGWKSDTVAACLNDFVEAMKPVYPSIKHALVAYAQDVANQENAGRGS